NIFSAASDNSKILQVIFFAVLLGIAIILLPNEKMQPVIRFFDAFYLIMLKVVDFIISTAPIGVAALMAGLVVDFSGQLSMFGALGIYALTTIAGLLLLMFGFYPLLIRLFTKKGVKHFLRTIYPVQLFAFTTSSSAATLPLNLDVTENKLGVSNQVTSFVLPVGATINMDGTSLFQTIAVIFIAQVLGIELSFSALVTVVMMSVISSIGTPSVPGGSYVIMTMVLSSVGIPEQGLALILGIERPLDMLRTAVNVTGDATVASIVDQSVTPVAETKVISGSSEE
ncbi:MAG: dicarboxylate/amino acid:cation symporter, partial [Bacteroidales bacterium]